MGDDLSYHLADFVSSLTFLPLPRLFIGASHHSDFSQAVIRETYLSYLAAECKTNLDKTMFQEAAATALDLKTTIPGAKYYLLCEWLDMTPISSATTAIDEIIILRKGKRLASNIRQESNTIAGRKQHRKLYLEHLLTHPFAPETFARILNHIHGLAAPDRHDESQVLNRGYF